MFSIITPTFNRKKLVLASIRSSINFCNDFKKGEEIIVVDDGSNDKTQKTVQEEFNQFFLDKKINYKYLSENKGVTNAKNVGAEIAKNDWLVFLDSDDQILPNSRKTITDAIEAFQDADVLFFRCVDQSMNIVGKHTDISFLIKLNDYIKNGTYGECLPIIKKSVFLKYKYDSDLRGFEGLTYLRMIKNDLNLYLIKDAARKYDDLGKDRLSTKRSVFKRSDKILKGYLRYKKEVFNLVGYKSKIYILIKIIQFYIFALINKITK